MPAADVVQAFRRFDKDGSGSISREELETVLRLLTPQARARNQQLKRRDPEKGQNA